MEYQGITKVLTVHPDGEMNIFTKCHDNLSRGQNIHYQLLLVNLALKESQRIKVNVVYPLGTTNEHFMGSYTAVVEIFHSRLK